MALGRDEVIPIADGLLYHAGRKLIGYYLLPAVILGSYLVLSSLSISLPGLEYDEALHAPAAIALLKGEQTGTSHPLLSLRLTSISLPVMHLEYLGSLKSYLLALSFGLFGASVKTLRFATILVGFLGLIFFALLVKDFFDQRTAVLSVLLVSTDPSFILYCRQDWGPIAIAFALRMMSLFSLVRWMRGGKAYHLICASACMGLGLYDKANFAWFITGVAVTAMVIAITAKRRPPITRGQGIAAAITFFVTSAPVWALNIWCHWPTLRAAVNGANNQGLIDRISALKATLQGTATNGWMFGETVTPGFSFNATVLWPFFVVAFLFLLFRGFSRANNRLQCLALFSLITTVIFQILLTPQPIGPHHWVSLYPMPHLAIAILLLEASNIRIPFLQQSRVVGLSAAAATIVLVLNLSTVAHHHALAQSTGGYRSWSDGIYRLAEVVKKDFADRPIQLMDWGFATQLSLLSGGKLHLHEPFWYEYHDSRDQQALVRRFCALLKNRDNVFVIQATETTKYPHARAAFNIAVKQTGLSPNKEEVIFDRLGNELCRVLVF